MPGITTSSLSVPSHLPNIVWLSITLFCACARICQRRSIAGINTTIFDGGRRDGRDRCLPAGSDLLGLEGVETHPAPTCRAMHMRASLKLDILHLGTLLRNAHARMVHARFLKHKVPARV
jgi:hypothetical protein